MDHPARSFVSNPSNHTPHLALTDPSQFGRFPLRQIPIENLAHNVVSFYLVSTHSENVLFSQANLLFAKTEVSLPLTGHS